jgi:hypothetical protein
MDERDIFPEDEGNETTYIDYDILRTDDNSFLIDFANNKLKLKFRMEQEVDEGTFNWYLRINDDEQETLWLTIENKGLTIRGRTDVFWYWHHLAEQLEEHDEEYAEIGATKWDNDLDYDNVHIVRLGRRRE